MRQRATTLRSLQNYKTKRRSFKQWLRDWLNDDQSKISEEIYEVSIGSNSIMQTLDCDKGITFKVFKASGGTIIETNFYDRSKDRHMNSLHVIVDGEDIGKAIGKIITMETLKL